MPNGQHVNIGPWLFAAHSGRRCTCQRRCSSVAAGCDKIQQRNEPDFATIVELDQKSVHTRPYMARLASGGSSTQYIREPLKRGLAEFREGPPRACQVRRCAHQDEADQKRGNGKAAFVDTFATPTVASRRRANETNPWEHSARRQLCARRFGLPSAEKMALQAPE